MAPKASLKRPAASQPAKAKKQRSQQSECAVVAAALAESGLPEHERALLKAFVPHALGVFAEQRHAYQAKAVEYLAEALSGIERRLHEESATTAAKVAALDDEKAQREGAVIAAARAIAAAKGAEALREAELVEAGQKVDKAGDALKAKQKEAKGILATHGAAAARREQLAILRQNELPPLREAAASAKVLAQFTKQARELGIDDASLLEASQHALAKEPAARAEFDSVVLSNLEAALDARAAAMDSELAGLEPEKAQREQAVGEAQACDEAARAVQAAAKAAVATASAEVRAAQSELQRAEKALKSYPVDAKEAAQKMADAKKAANSFTEGALATFLALKDRTQPPQSPAEEEEEEAAEAAPEQADAAAAGAGATATATATAAA